MDVVLGLAALIAIAWVRAIIVVLRIERAVAAGEDPKAAGVRMGLAPARVRAFLDTWDKATA